MKHIPVRTCIVCRESKDKSDLLRIVRKPDGDIVVDETGRTPGRGAYVCKAGDCMRTAIVKHIFNRAYKQQIPQSVYDVLGETCGVTGNNERK